MRELALHVLDLIENSLRAGANKIAVGICENPQSDLLSLTVEDNGAGLPETFEEDKMPFYTTKAGKKVGLGLSMFRAAVEEAGGRMTLSTSCLGGLKVVGDMKLSHIDRKPLGDMCGTLFAIACTNPDVDLRITVRREEEERSVSLAAIRAAAGSGERSATAIARRLADNVRECLAILSIKE